MIDIHSHILPFVDDGSDSIKGSIELIKYQIKNGVNKIVLTPHFKTDKYETSKEELINAFENFKEEVKSQNLEVELYLAQEIYVGGDFYNIINAGGFITVNNTKNILIEFNCYIETDILKHVSKIVSLGYTPIIAHIERYSYFDFHNLYDIKKMGALIQVNASSIVGKSGKNIQNIIFDAIYNGYIDFVASDLHKGRKPYMLKAYKKVKKLFGEETAEKLFNENAQNILK